MKLVDGQGRPVALGERIAGGGEGTVYRIPARPDQVAKIYHQPPSAERVAKLRTMATVATAELTKLACWPTDLLSDVSGGTVCGFTMPNASGFKEAHKLYSPKSREVEFQQADWRFLVNAAANIARAFAVVHAQGQVIGDVNHSSVMVAPDSTVRLIDCDSFQIEAGGHRFRCEAAEPLHRAPELFGQTVADVIHTPNHDNFGLAVLIFELLFMGRHPFAGAYEGKEDLSLEQKIACCMFAYGAGAAKLQVRQPPNTLSLSAVSPTLAAMFEAAFGPAGATSARPTALQWANSLSGFLGQLKKCGRDENHYFYHGLVVCPWCEIERKLGISLFNLAFAPTSLLRNSSFRLALVWDRILDVEPPEPMDPPSADNRLALRPDARYLNAGRRRKRANLIAALAGVAAIIVAFSLPWITPLVLVAGVIVVGAIMTVGRSASDVLRSEGHLELSAASNRYVALCNRWDQEATADKFTEILERLDAARQDYEDLPNFHQSEMARLQSSLREAQLRRYLDGFRIKAGDVPGIGEGRCIILRSYGIETAADVDFMSVYGVPGFGEQLATKLVEWRERLERKFRFDPGKGVSPEDRRKLDASFHARQRALEAELLGGAARLTQAAQEIERARQALLPELEGALDASMRINANLEAL